MQTTVKQNLFPMKKIIKNFLYVCAGIVEIIILQQLDVRQVIIIRSQKASTRTHIIWSLIHLNTNYVSLKACWRIYVFCYLIEAINLLPDLYCNTKKHYNTSIINILLFTFYFANVINDLWKTSISRIITDRLKQSLSF